MIDFSKINASSSSTSLRTNVAYASFPIFRIASTFRMFLWKMSTRIFFWEGFEVYYLNEYKNSLLYRASPLFIQNSKVEKPTFAQYFLEAMKIPKSYWKTINLIKLINLKVTRKIHVLLYKNLHVYTLKNNLTLLQSLQMHSEFCIKQTSLNSM